MEEELGAEGCDATAGQCWVDPHPPSRTSLKHPSAVLPSVDPSAAGGTLELCASYILSHFNMVAPSSASRKGTKAPVILSAVSTGRKIHCTPGQAPGKRL